MPIAVSGNEEWLALLKQKEVEPLFLLSIAGSIYYFLSGEQRLSSIFHDPVTNKMTIPNSLQLPKGIKANISQADGRITAGSITFRVVNFGKYIEDVITGGTGEGTASQGFSKFFNQSCLLYMGYKGLADSSWLVIYQGNVKEVRESSPGEFEIITVNKLFTDLEGRIMTNCDGEAANEVKVTGNPINILLRIMVDAWDLTYKKGYLANFPIDAKVGTPTGLGIDNKYLNWEQWITERDLWYPDLKVQWRWRNSINARAWLEEQVFKLFGVLVPIIGESGGEKLTQFSFYAFHPLQPPATPRILTTSNFIGFPQWSKNYPELINRVKVWGDWDPDAADPDDEFTLLADIETPDSGFTPSAIGEERLLEIKHTGLKDSITYDSTTWTGGSDYAEDMARRILSKYGHGGPEKLSANISLSEYDLYPMDLVAITNEHLPSYLAGRRMEGKNEENFEVIGLEPNFEKASIKASLQKSYSKRYAFLHPDTSPPDYLDASEEERQYFYLCDTDEKMSNGDPGYHIP